MTAFDTKLSVRQVRLRQIETGDLAFYNALCARHIADCLELPNGEAARITQAVGPVSSDLIPLGLRIGDEEFGLSVDKGLMRAAFRHFFGAVHSSGRAKTADLLLNLLFDIPLGRLEDISGEAVVLIPRRTFPDPVCFYRVTWAGQTGDLALSAEAAALLVRLAPLNPAPRPELPILVSLRTGRALITPADLTDLHPGDVIVPNQRPILPDHPDVHIGPNLIAAADVVQGQATLKEDIQMTPDAHPLADDLDTPVDQLELTLTFELARKAVTLSELSEVTQGHVFTFRDHANPCSVRILANGKAIGRGELVQVGDHIAVQVTERT